MKKIVSSGLLLVGMIIVLMISSCEKNLGPPTITFLEADGFTSQDTMMMVGDTVTLGVILDWNGANNLQSLDVLVSDNLLKTYALDQEKGEYSFKLEKSASEEEIWKFVLRDSKGNETSKEIKLTRDPNSVYGGILSFQSINLGAQGNPLIPGFLSLEGPTLYDINSAFLHQSTIDLVYYFDEVDEHVIASPGANIPSGIFTGDNTIDTWATIITTRFVKSDFTEEEFSTFFYDGFLIDNYDNDIANRKAKNLKPGDVYLFQTESGRLGAFCIKVLEGAIDGELEISLLIQD